MFRTSCTICPPSWLWQMWIWRSPEQRRTRRTTGHSDRGNSHHIPCSVSEPSCVPRQTWHWPDGYSPASCQSSICGTQDITQDVTQGVTQSDTQDGTQGGTQDGTQEEILDKWIENRIRENPQITTEELAKMSNKGIATIKRHIAKMPYIRYVGSGADTW